MRDDDREDRPEPKRARRQTLFMTDVLIEYGSLVQSFRQTMRTDIFQQEHRMFPDEDRAPYINAMHLVENLMLLFSAFVARFDRYDLIAEYRRRFAGNSYLLAVLDGQQRHLEWNERERAQDWFNQLVVMSRNPDVSDVDFIFE